MKIITKINESEYEIGKYTVIDMYNGWTVKDGDEVIAVFYKKHKALAWTNINYTCGTLVSKGVRELLLIEAQDKEDSE